MQAQATLTPAAFVEKWRGVTTTERASSQSHFNDEPSFDRSRWGTGAEGHREAYDVGAIGRISIGSTDGMGRRVARRPK